MHLGLAGRKALVTGLTQDLGAIDGGPAAPFAAAIGDRLEAWGATP